MDSHLTWVQLVFCNTYVHRDTYLFYDKVFNGLTLTNCDLQAR